MAEVPYPCKVVVSPQVLLILHIYYAFAAQYFLDISETRNICIRVFSLMEVSRVMASAEVGLYKQGGFRNEWTADVLWAAARGGDAGIARSVQYLELFEFVHLLKERLASGFSGELSVFGYIVIVSAYLSWILVWAFFG